MAHAAMRSDKSYSLIVIGSCKSLGYRAISMSFRGVLSSRLNYGNLVVVGLIRLLGIDNGGRA
jgi:hypothetical protein